MVERLPQPDDEWVVDQVRKAAGEAYSELAVIRGAAVVFWDREGTTRTQIFQDAGCSIPYGAVPAVVHDAMVIHIADQLARRNR
jgi:hypothetical protein